MKLTTKTAKLLKFSCAVIAVSFASGSFAADYYLPPTSFKLDGQSPRFGVIGDFNADGVDDLAAVFPIPDKVTGAITSSRINFLVGSRFGTLKIETTFPLPFDVISMATGDFDGDGQPDMAVAPSKADGASDPYCGTQQGVVIFSGFLNEVQPDLRFAACLTTPPDELWTLDTNGDGLADLIVGTRLFLSNGDGTFTAGNTLPAGDNQIADINGDGREDVVTADQGLCSNGDGSFSACALPPNDPLVATDPQGDIVTENAGTGYIIPGNTYSYLCPSCWGRNQAAMPFSRQATADLDGDGSGDWVGAVVTSLEHPVTTYYSKCGWGYHIVNVYRPGAGRGRSRPGGSYSRRRMWLYTCSTRDYYFPGSTFHSIVQNTVIPGMSALRVSLIRSDGSVEQILGPEVHGYFRSLKVADVNGDGQPDVLADIAKVGNDGGLENHPDYPDWTLFTGKGDGTFNPPEPTGLSLSAVIPGDFNGDGLTDFGAYITPFDSEHLLSVAFHNPPTAPPAPAADTTPPTVAITAPTDGETVSGVVQLTANASDDTGVAGIVFQVNGTTLGQVATAPYQTSWDTSKLTPGSYTLQAVATDAAGNSSTASVTVTVAAPPAASPTPAPSPVPTDAQPTGNQVEFSGTVTEAGTDYFVVDGSLRVSIGPASILKYQDGFGPAPKVGDPVQGKADEYSDGTHVAVKAEFG